MSFYISIFFGVHDSGVAFADNDQVLLHLDAERVLRRKHARTSTAEMEALVDTGLKYLNRTIGQVDTLFVGRWGCMESASLTLLGRRFAPVWTSHHANHVGLGRFLGWPDAVVVCADGGSEVGCSAIYDFNGQNYVVTEDLDETILTGQYYGTLTQLVIGDDFERAHVHWPGKTMGLSAFGRDDPDLRERIAAVEGELKKLHVHGIQHLSQALGLTSQDHDHSWRRWNLARTAQLVWEELWVKTLERHASRSPRLLMSGGCALNVLLNYRLRQSQLFQQIFIPPCPGDDGQAIGALLHQLNLRCRFPYLGRNHGEMTRCPQRAVDDLAAGRIVLWFNGRSEVGPRALGHRSMLALPNLVSQRVKLSEVVKRREWYRPVGAIVREEVASRWFCMDGPSPYMLEAVPVRPRTWEKAPGIVHIDGTCRVQTLSRDQDPILHELLVNVEQATGLPMLINTSLNLPDDPICDTPDDAIATFRECGADVLYLVDERFEL
jgi:carbamoyltransferase